MIRQVSIILVVAGILALWILTAFAQVGPLGVGPLAFPPAAGGGGCPNALNFSDGCDSMYISRFM